MATGNFFKHWPTMLLGVVVAVILLIAVFSYQLNQTESAVVTTFGSPAAVTDPGLHFRWPFPFQKIYKFDHRIRCFEGGSGKSHVLTPCTLKVENGAATATIVWSSQKYDYMLVDGQRYDVLTTEGGSTFEIPVRALDTPLTVIGDTTAMSTPHEIEYTLTFDSSTAVEAAQ